MSVLAVCTVKVMVLRGTEGYLEDEEPPYLFLMPHKSFLICSNIWSLLTPL